MQKKWEDWAWQGKKVEIDMYNRISSVILERSVLFHMTSFNQAGLLDIEH